MGGPDANTDRLKQSISAVRTSGGFPGNRSGLTIVAIWRSQHGCWCLGAFRGCWLPCSARQGRWHSFLTCQVWQASWEWRWSCWPGAACRQWVWWFYSETWGRCFTFIYWRGGQEYVMPARLCSGCLWQLKTIGDAGIIRWVYISHGIPKSLYAGDPG